MCWGPPLDRELLAAYLLYLVREAAGQQAGRAGNSSSSRPVQCLPSTTHHQRSPPTLQPDQQTFDRPTPASIDLLGRRERDWEGRGVLEAGSDPVSEWQ